MKIQFNDVRIGWFGHVSLVYGEDWVMPYRLPYKTRRLYWPEKQIKAAMYSSGVRMIFRTDARRLFGTLQPYEVGQEESKLDLCIDNRFIRSARVDENNRFGWEELPDREKNIEIWLPTNRDFRLKYIEINDDATIEALTDKRPVGVFCGSSLTHCAGAESPTLTWPAIFSRRTGMNLINLGLGGCGFLEPLMAMLMRDIPARLYVIKTGINIYRGGSYNMRTFIPAVMGTVRSIREKHPDTPVFVISPVYAPIYEGKKNQADVTLEGLRNWAAEAVGILTQHGDKNVFAVNGHGLLAPGEDHLIPEGLHPNSEGYKTMGERFIEIAGRKLGIEMIPPEI